MYNVISFSGGRTSAYMVLEVLKRHPDAHIIFMDTGAEHPATYQFIRDIVNNWGLQITCLRAWPADKMGKAGTYEIVSLDNIGPDLEPWKRMLNKYGHPYVGGAFCTDRMKTVPFTKYCQDVFGKDNYTTWLGIRIDEPKRLKPRAGFSYLADISDFDKQDILDWWSEQPFDLGIQEHLGNCVFCIKKSLQKVALATKDEPELARQFVAMLDENDIKDDKIMYRSNNSLNDVIALFGDTERNELASRMRSMRQYDTGSCSESCEAFPTGDDNVKLSDKAFFLIDEEIKQNGIPALVESPFDYNQSDKRVTHLGAGVFVCEFESTFYMGSFDDSYYNGDIESPWSWVEIDRATYDVLKVHSDR